MTFYILLSFVAHNKFCIFVISSKSCSTINLFKPNKYVRRSFLSLNLPCIILSKPSFLFTYLRNFNCWCDCITYLFVSILSQTSSTFIFSKSNATVTAGIRHISIFLDVNWYGAQTFINTFFKIFFREYLLCISRHPIERFKATITFGHGRPFFFFFFVQYHENRNDNDVLLLTDWNKKD